MKIVISQPMFLPWLGMFEQLNLCDIFVFYDDVQMPQGRSFINRVQIKTINGIKWLTVPIDKKRSLININDTYISYNEKWQDNHKNTLRHCFSKSKYNSEVMQIVEKIYSLTFLTISELNIYAFKLIAKFYNIKAKFVKSSNLKIQGKSTQKLLNIVKHLNGNTYISGLGALNYLNHNLFEKESIQVKYMKYNKFTYNQKFGDFTPFVSILDLIANEGKDGIKYISSPSIYWKTYIK